MITNRERERVLRAFGEISQRFGAEGKSTLFGRNLFCFPWVRSASENFGPYETRRRAEIRAGGTPSDQGFVHSSLNNLC